ncbi:cell wall-binding repeat-containing protein [Microbacterium sp. SS28]|uniref:cell wall-binding repeat-containing protein n=1 Tax=Microbacterium sp. SS28 TaxID=2919948 RepID=UPI001FAA8971|nr:cell wall-binding repeat-containing protein [Microbacterium sp. SS28]
MVVAVQPAAAATNTASQLPGLLKVADETTSPAYDRDRFEHWIDVDGDGCNTRYEVLIEESTTSLSVGAGCYLTNGTWVSPYDGATATSPSGIEIDHVVALAEAWRSGASGWTDEQRRSFANDLDVPYALTAASSASNQSKSDKDPAEWLPPNTANTCEYVTSWATIKYRWSLTTDAAEQAALKSVLSGDCGDTEVTLPTVMITSTETDPDETVPDQTVPGETVPGETVPGEPVPGETAPGETVIAPFAPDTTTRLAGIDRYATSIATSQRYAPGVPVLFVALGSNFPDALSAASAAAVLGGPLLTTTGDTIQPSTLSEVIRLAPKQIYVTGDARSISESVVQALRTVAPTTRLGGADRFETGRIIVNTAFTASSHAIIANGRNFPDALAATGAAGSRQAPVVLVEGAAATVPPETLGMLAQLGVTSLSIVGDQKSVSAGIESQLRSAIGSVTRYGGAGRYETAAMINDAYFPGAVSTAFVAAGSNFPDALSAAALAGYLRAPLYITAQPCVPEAVHVSLNRVGGSARVVMGDTKSVGDAAAANLGCMTVGQPTISGTTTVNSTLSANPGPWTAGTQFSYQWYANGSPVSGTGSTLLLTSALAGKSIAVQVTGSATGYLGASATSAATGAVGYPSRTKPITGTWNCPAWAPIKGNADSMIYHMPGGQFYDATNPEECFSTESAAVAAGYRKSLR